MNSQLYKYSVTYLQRHFTISYLQSITQVKHYSLTLQYNHRHTLNYRGVRVALLALLSAAKSLSN